MSWAFIYTREAHPGEKVGPHQTLDDKLTNARLLHDKIGIRRPILVDDLEGTTHRAFGLLPNMTWVIGRGGRILYKADWTSAINIESFLRRQAQPRPKATIGSYFTEQIEFRTLDREAFYDRLRRNGPRAYEEFKRAEDIWRRRP